jgi:predicted nucleic acid-binding protein
MSVLSLGEIVKGIAALENGLTLVTRNTKDFASLGVAIVNPWDRQVYNPANTLNLN